MTHLNVGFIGCGKIAGFHADALKTFGVNISAVSYHSNLENVKIFQSKYDTGNIYNDWREMCLKNKFDFLWVIPSWDQIDQIFEEIIEIGIPAFFEKPLGLSSSKIKRVLDKYDEEYLSRYQIGFNRRFYSVSNELTDLLSSEKIVAITGELPETLIKSDPYLLKYRLIQNSSHFYDLLAYVLGSYSFRIEYLEKIRTQYDSDDHLIVMKHGEIPISISSIWGSPQNYSIKFYTESEKVIILSPFEELNVYQGFTIIEPTKDVPIRRYKPKVLNTLYENSGDFKPGFVEQTKDFLENTIEAGKSITAHGIKDSFHLLTLLEKISAGKSGNH